MARRAASRKASRKPARKTAPRRAAASGRRSPPRRAATAGKPAAARPPPFRTVTPYLAVHNAAHAVDWYRQAFGARELSRMPGPDGKLMHAELMVGDSRVMLSDIFAGSDMKDPRGAGPSATLHLYHKDVDRLWQRAVDAGARITMPLANQFWGDRYGKLVDPFGHSWSLAYRAKMGEEERRRLQTQAMAAFSAGEHP